MTERQNDAIRASNLDLSYFTLPLALAFRN